jgi:RTX calcium-binding nonapeptide repeat (4 copies)
VRRSAVTLLLLGFLAVPAVAATIRGTAHADRLTGTRGADAIFGLAGRDRLLGLAGNDLLDGGPGRDVLTAGAGSDRIWAAQDAGRDTVLCGRGRDLVDAELADAVSADCEVVVRQLSRDELTNSDSQHQTQVEPASAAFGRTIVAAFQSGRFDDGGASNIGFATSSDAGRTWRSGFLPGLTAFSKPVGTDERASDPSVAYDAVHGVWLVASLGLGAGPVPWHLLVSSSRDGLQWNPPVAAVTGTPESLDKEWIACDNWPSSPFRGRCYLSYLDVAQEAIATRTSTEGGSTWGPGVLGPPNPKGLIGAQPVVRPDGTVVVLHVSAASSPLQDDEVLALRSADGGASFSPSARIAAIQSSSVRDLRDPSFPSVGIDSSGRTYAAWHDCRFSSGCSRNDLVLTASDDGVTWSDPVRIPTTAAASGVDSLICGLGADPSAQGRLALVYYTRPSNLLLGVATIASSDGGATWTKPQRLSVTPMDLSWLAGTDTGSMVGDYVALSYVRGRPIPVFSLASEPAADGTLRQSIFARVR